jgi:hypothetical protein
MFKSIPVKSLIFGAAILYGAGCQPQTTSHGEEFPPDEKVSAVTRQNDTQAGRAARQDGTLNSCHFDGAELNSLGMARLDLMLKDDSGTPLTIWMAVPDDENAAGRRFAVATFLKDRGLSADQIKFASGANPGMDHPAGQGIKDLIDMDNSGGGAPPAAAGPGLGH